MLWQLSSHQGLYVALLSGMQPLFVLRRSPAKAICQLYTGFASQGRISFPVAAEGPWGHAEEKLNELRGKRGLALSRAH
jgi:hypothetical protein